MANYENDLLQDLESDDEIIQQDSFQSKLNDLIQSNLLSDSFQTILNYPDIEQVEDFTKLSKVYPLINELREKIIQFSNDEEIDYLNLLSSLENDLDQSEEYKFILLINELTTIINNEITVFVTLIKMQYKLLFPELESLILNPIDYVKVIMLIKQDLKNIKNYETELKLFLSGDKVLIIIMAVLQQSNNIPQQEFNKILSCGTLVLELNKLLQQLSNFLADKLSKIAPNVSTIVGPITTSQILIATGSLKQLASTPSCNIPALGVRDLSSTTKTKNIRQTGYLYHCDLIKYLPPEIMRSAMRIISGKIILAARIDLSKSSPDGELGQKLLSEIQVKIDKLLAPPEQTPDKALPAPVEQKSKKRGGRRFRKMKERFQMSDLRKAQNKMEFGKEEDTIMDSFGKEIGLGMSKYGNNGKLGQIQISSNTSARMSKSMINRLQQQQQQQKEKSIFDTDLDELIFSGTNEEKPKETKPTSKWLGGITKRKLNESDEVPNKKVKL
ncbi:unnamed protein product [Candida verbasci]|uniref:Nop domain-containing protein n=1 Tax=Candida verbasci TaxID=1227364 RepID=A0A9W4TVK7_9ASCO|nr:unnamed protein product [Candida verbasci]